MMRRSRLARRIPAVLTLFFVANGLPREALVVHRHPGDDRPHVHAFDEELQAPSHAEASHHHRPAGRLGPGETRLEEAESRLSGHVHWRHPFRWAAAVALPSLVPGARLVALPPEAPAERLIVHSAPTPARAPPSVG